MDKAAYLEAQRRRRAEAPAFKREDFCYRCYWIREHCLCARIQPFDTAIRFVILMHTKEARREKLGTGRISHATLNNSEIIVGVDFTENARVNALIADPQNHCLVLYPGPKAVNVSSDDVAPLKEEMRAGRRVVVFLVDGTWQCAKKMMTLSANVRALPRVSFTAKHESIFYIKQQPAEFCLSTLESIHFFLGEADRRGLEQLPGRPQDNLIAVFRAMIDFMMDCARDPERRPSYRGARTGYSDPATRTRRSPASGRCIILRD